MFGRCYSSIKNAIKRLPDEHYFQDLNLKKVELLDIIFLSNTKSKPN